MAAVASARAASARARGLQCGCGAARDTLAEDSQALGERVGRAAGDFQFLIQLQQPEIIGCNLAEQAQSNTTACFLGGEKSGASTFVEPSDATPEVHFPE